MTRGPYIASPENMPILVGPAHPGIALPQPNRVFRAKQTPLSKRTHGFLGRKSSAQTYLIALL